MDLTNDPRFKGIEAFPNKLWLSSPTMHGDEQRFVDEAIQTNWVSTVGKNIDLAEEQIASLVGVKHAVALSSGTAALHLGVRLLAEKLYGQAKTGHGTLEGKRVFCSDLTFSATVNPVAYEGGEAIFVDTEIDTWNMSPEALQKAFEMYPDVKLVVIAHLYGTPGKINEIRAICRKHGALILEDAAESLGATYRTTLPEVGEVGSDDCDSCKKDCKDHKNREKQGLWQQTGSFGDVGVVSFNGNKIITSSGSGMLLTNSLEDANRVRKWSTQSREAAPWYCHEELGYNYRCSNILASIILGQIPHLQEHINQKKAIWERYREGLKGLPVDMNPWDEGNSRPNFWLSCLLIRPEAMSPMVRSDREYLYKSELGRSCPQEIYDALKMINAESRPIWRPMHMQSYYSANPFVTIAGSGRGQSNAYIDGSTMDIGADIFNRGLCLPSDNKMTIEQQDRVIEVIRRCFD